MKDTPHVPDPLELLSRITRDEILERLDRLAAEEKGLRVLLRSLSARDRANAHSIAEPELQLGQEKRDRTGSGTAPSQT